MCERQQQERPEDVLPGEMSDYLPEHILSTVKELDPKFTRKIRDAAFKVCGYSGYHKDVQFRTWEPYTTSDGKEVWRVILRCPTGTIGVVITKSVDGGFAGGCMGWSHTKKKGKPNLSHSARAYFKDFASDVGEALEQWKETA